MSKLVYTQYYQSNQHIFTSKHAIGPFSDATFICILLTLADIIEVNRCKERMDTDLLVAESFVNISQQSLDEIADVLGHLNVRGEA